MLQELFLPPLLIFAKIPGHSSLGIKMGNNLTTWDIAPSHPSDLLPQLCPSCKAGYAVETSKAGKAMDTDLCPRPEATLGQNQRIWKVLHRAKATSIALSTHKGDSWSLTTDHMPTHRPLGHPPLAPSISQGFGEASPSSGP